MAAPDLDESFPAEIFEPDEGAPFTDGELQAYLDEAAIVPDGRGDVLFAEQPTDAPGDEHTFAPSRWRITDEGLAAWALQRYADAAAELAAVDARHAYMADRVAAWHRRNQRDPRARMAFFGHALEEYAVGRRIEDPKHKTVNLPNGKVSTTLRGPVVDVDEEELLIAWAEGAVPAAVNTTKSIRKTELREAVSLLEYPTVVVFTCACVVTLFEDHRHAETLQRGTAKECPSCGKDALVGDWLETKLVVVDADGDVVPGTRVEPGRVTATVKPA